MTINMNHMREDISEDFICVIITIETEHSKREIVYISSYYTLGCFEITLQY